MEYIIHRVNNLEKLSKISKNHGAEIDVVYDNNQLILKHSPYDSNREAIALEDFLKMYDNKKLIINIKTSGTEENIINLARKYLDDFLLLDVEFPFIIKNYKKYGKYLMLRISKFESIENLEYLNNYINWIWLDTYEEFEFDNNYKNLLNSFKICVVSIERWFENYETSKFINEIKNSNLNIQAVLTDNKIVKEWEKSYRT